MTFKLGATVEWTSSANATTNTKRGKIMEVVPRGVKPRMTGALPRKHESYVVQAYVVGAPFPVLRYYWPRVNALRDVTP